MISNNVMEENLFKMYDDIHLGSSSVCKDCHEKTTNLSSPISFWFVGSNYEHENGRVLLLLERTREVSQGKREIIIMIAVIKQKNFGIIHSHIGAT